MVEKGIGDKIIRLIRGDVTDLEVEAFAFDITSDCQLGSGYGGAIAQRGGKSVQEELNSIGTLPMGEAVVTAAGQMKAKYIIHTNGPKYRETDTAEKLEKATKSVLRRADEKGITELALPPIGTAEERQDQPRGRVVRGTGQPGVQAIAGQDRRRSLRCTERRAARSRLRRSSTGSRSA
jgi:hypothetical protein